MGDQFVPRCERNVVKLGPVFKRDKVGGDDDGRELALIPNDGGGADERIQFQRIFNRLGCDEFSARSFDQIFLAIGDRQISIGVDVADIAGFKPVFDEGSLRFFGTIPISLKDRRAAHQNFTVFGDTNFEIWKRLTYGSDAMVDGSVYRNHGRGLGETVALVNADAGAGIPLGQFTAKGRAARDEGLDPSAHTFADFGKYQFISHLPIARGWRTACENLRLVSVAHGKCP